MGNIEKPTGWRIWRRVISPQTLRFLVWDWRTIDYVGKMKALRKSLVFIALAALLTKVLGELPPSVTLPWTEPPVIIHLQLPFTWIILFWCAVAVSIGNIGYLFFCPKLVKTFPSYARFQEAGGQLADLAPHFWTMGNLASIADPTLSDNHFEAAYHRINNKFHNSTFPSKNIGPESKEVSFLYRFIVDASNISHPYRRLFCSFFYLLGLALLGWVLCENLIQVIQFQYFLR